MLQPAVVLQEMLFNKAIVIADETSITLRPLDFENGKLSHYHLEFIKDPRWNEITIPNDIEVVLEGWCFDTKDHNFGADIWCLNWMKSRFNVVDKMQRIWYSQDNLFFIKDLRT